MKMTDGCQRLCQQGVWTPIYKGPSSGFIYITNQSNERIEFKSKATSASAPFFLKEIRTLHPGQKVAVFSDAPTPYVNFKIKACNNDIRVLVSWSQSLSLSRSVGPKVDMVSGSGAIHSRPCL
jgi:hypothetical protein